MRKEGDREEQKEREERGAERRREWGRRRRGVMRSEGGCKGKPQRRSGREGPVGRE